MTAGDPSLLSGQAGRVFATTRWTVVLQAGGPTSEGSAAALGQLCRTYWYPLYTYARRIGMPAHDAEDLTQSFFAYLLEKDSIARADRERGRFRSFLLTAFKNFNANEHARNSTTKRGGGHRMVSLDELQAENRYQLEPQTELTPEKLYDQKWAASLLEQVMATLRAEYEVLNKGPLFDLLRSVVWGGRQEGGYEELARQAGISEGAFKVAVHRMRNRFKECLRQEVAQTVVTPGEIDDELRHLLTALG
jgi:RNA polymerase sigma factor (sigma-70 family)